MLTADHGESLHDHGERGHGGTLYNELIRVPFVVWGAGSAGVRARAPVSLVDFVPTALAVGRIRRRSPGLARCFVAWPAGRRRAISRATHRGRDRGERPRCTGDHPLAVQAHRRAGSGDARGSSTCSATSPRRWTWWLSANPRRSRPPSRVAASCCATSAVGYRAKRFNSTPPQVEGTACPRLHPVTALR